MSFETECFSMNSDMSKRTKAFSVPNMNCARVRATSVLPTPSGRGTGTSQSAGLGSSILRANAGSPGPAR